MKEGFYVKYVYYIAVLPEGRGVLLKDSEMLVIELDQARNKLVYDNNFHWSALFIVYYLVNRKSKY